MDASLLGSRLQRLRLLLRALGALLLSGVVSTALYKVLRGKTKQIEDNSQYVVEEHSYLRQDDVASKFIDRDFSPVCQSQVLWESFPLKGSSVLTHIATVFESTLLINQSILLSSIKPFTTHQTLCLRCRCQAYASQACFLFSPVNDHK